MGKITLPDFILSHNNESMSRIRRMMEDKLEDPLDGATHEPRI